MSCVRTPTCHVSDIKYEPGNPDARVPISTPRPSQPKWPRVQSVGPDLPMLHTTKGHGATKRSQGNTGTCH